MEVTVDEALEAIVDSEYLAALPDPVAHKRAHGRVDSARRRAHTHHGERVCILALAGHMLRLDLAQLQTGLQIALKAFAAQLNNLVIQVQVNTKSISLFVT